MLSALVLTAGLGTRLAPLTHVVAKPAVPLAGQTLIERVLRWLHSQGVTSTVLNLHHLPETITRVVGDGAHLGLRVRYSWEPIVLGSAGGPRHALALIDSDPFLVVNGDTLSGVELAGMQAAFASQDADVLMAVVPNPAPHHYNGIVLDDEHRVVRFVKKGPEAEGSWHFIGVQIVRKCVFADLPDNEVMETVAGIYRDFVAESPGRVRAWPVKTPFLDVGTPADYRTAALELARGDDRVLIEDGADVDPSAELRATIVWRGSRVGPHARLSRCIVAGGDVPAHATHDDELLMPGLRSRIS